MEHTYQAPTGWFASNIQDIGAYIRTLQAQVQECGGGRLTIARLKAAIDEDTHGTIGLQECQRLIVLCLGA